MKDDADPSPGEVAEQRDSEPISNSALALGYAANRKRNLFLCEEFAYVDSDALRAMETPCLDDTDLQK